jgi:hypothetical protein
LARPASARSVKPWERAGGRSAWPKSKADHAARRVTGAARDPSLAE